MQDAQLGTVEITFAFQKSGQKEDEWAVIRHLDSLTGKYPTVLGLVAKLEKLVVGQC